MFSRGLDRIDRPLPVSWMRAVAPPAVAAVAIAVFLPAIWDGFSDFDDHGVLLETEGYRGLGPDHLAWMFTTTHMGHYQPLTWMSYALDWMVWGLDPRGFHLTSVLIHAINAVLVYGLAVRLIGAARGEETAGSISTRLAAAVGAVLWAVHPLRTESVAWITERRDVLSGMFLLLATLAYLRAFPPGSLRPASGRWYAASVALLVLSLLSKAWGMTFFVVVLSLDVFPLRRLHGPPWAWLGSPLRSIVLQKAPYAALGLVFALQAARAQASHAQTVKTLAEWGPTDRLCQAVYGLKFYLERFVWPVRLSCLYELPASLHPSEPRIIASGVVVAAAATIAVVVRRRWPALAAALAVYAVVLSPVLGLFQSGIQIVADRYSYLAHIGLCLAIAGGLAGLAPVPMRWAEAALAGAAVVLSTFTWSQARLWGDTERLFARALEIGDGPITREGYGRQLETHGKREAALAQFEAAIRLDPNYGEAHFSRGNVLKDLGRVSEAEREYKAAAALMKDPRPDLRLGILYAQMPGRETEAVAAFRAAVAKSEQPAGSFSPLPYLLLAEALHEAGDDAEARAYLRRASQYPETRAKALEHLGDLDGDAPPPE